MQAEELYFLLKPLCALGQVRGRTTAQKIFYLLQALGYPTRLEYFLHYYGPYSEDLASFLMSACQSDTPWLKQTVKPVQDGLRFDYEVTQEAKNLVGALEEKFIAEDLARRAENFCGIAKFLVLRPLASLEIAATILYLERERGYNRAKAVAKTKAIKATKANQGTLAKASRLLDELRRRAAQS
jgi:hypothetical protein